MKESQRAKWEQTRAKGFWRFVLLYWVLLWGGFMFIISSVYDYFFSRYGLSNMVEKALIILIVGFLAGMSVWFISEYRYQKSSRNAS